MWLAGVPDDRLVGIKRVFANPTATKKASQSDEQRTQTLKALFCQVKTQFIWACFDTC